VAHHSFVRFVQHRCREKSNAVLYPRDELPGWAHGLGGEAAVVLRYPLFELAFGEDAFACRFADAQCRVVRYGDILGLEFPKEKTEHPSVLSVVYAPDRATLTLPFPLDGKFSDSWTIGGLLNRPHVRRVRSDNAARHELQ